MLDTLVQDLRHATRGLRRSPGFTAVAVLTLGLGIGANTAIFSVVNAVLLRPLPYQEPARLVTVQHHYPSLDLDAPVSVPGFLDYRAQERVFAHAAVETGWAPNLTGTGEPERLPAARVTGEFFTTYGVVPLLGRTLHPDDAEPGHDQHVVVLSNGFWVRHFGAERGVVGRTMLLNGESYQIVGVMPASFRDFFNRRVELWAPIVFRPDQLGINNYTNEFLNFTGRLRPGVTVVQARADMHAFAGRLKADHPDRFSPNWDLKVTSLAELASGPVRTALFVLLGAVAFVLLIACANVANLQLARLTGRARDIAVRVALGASPRRLMRHLLTESVLLALLGGGLGLLLAVWGVPALLKLNTRTLPPATDVGIDASVLVFTLGVSVLTGFVFGLLPALQVARTDLHELLKEGGRGAAGGRGALALRRGLVVATVALALTLLAGAGLLIRSFSNLLAVDPGFPAERLLTFNVSLPAARYPNDTVRVAALERLADAVAAAPGVLAAGGTSVMPFGGNWSTGSFSVEGYHTPPNTPGPWGDIRVVTPGFLPALGARLLRGRQFTAQDGASSPRVAIVDEEMVSRYWKNQDPIGKRITFDDLDRPRPEPAGAAGVNAGIHWIEVVGVVRHTMHEGLDGQRRIQLYLPVPQNAISFMAMAVRTRGEPLSALGAVRAAVRSVDPDLPLASVNAMDALIETSTGPRRFTMLLLGVFAGLALLLASIGLYGVMSYTVTQRTQEIGVRVALGAGTREVLRLVLGQGMRLALVGVAIGFAAALGVTRLMKAMLFPPGANPTDLLTFASMSALLVLVAILASWLPARRAAGVHPITALRNE
jgi:putative ABC transport system permease protein